ncbi:MAG: Glycosyl transferase group 1, partial [Candidatus Daviesbacteria bacterium GW2011_GWB1_41_5]
RLVPWKGFKMLIKLMPRLLQINPFFRLVILGSGPDGKTLQAMINNLRLEKKVYLLPVPRAEIPLYLKAASIYVLNTGYEGFSHQILEAMLSRVPVITTRAGGNPEVIRQGENGFMVNYNDEFNLVEAIKTVWQGEELRERFVANGLITVEHFSLEKMFNETMAVLN